MRNYNTKYLPELKQGGVGRKRALLDISRFLRFAVKRCGAVSAYLPLESEDLEELIGLDETLKEVKVPLRPDQLFGLRDSLFDNPELRLAVTLAVDSRGLIALMLDLKLP